MTAPAAGPLPTDAVLLHIGPHKTGTTAIQSAFHHGRERLAEHGAHYAGPGSQPMLAALHATGRPGKVVGSPRQRHWTALVREVGSARDRRVVVSSERFCVATEEQIATIVDALGRDRVHVVVTLRPLAAVLPSQWQQYIKDGLSIPYGRWLHHVLEDPPFTRPSADFWRRHDHADVVRRWAAGVGADRLTVIVLDDRDRGMLTASFEQLLDLPAGTLVPVDDVTNRSLTAAETELVRLLNKQFRRKQWSPDLYVQFVRDAVSRPMQQRRPAAREARIATPRWALEAAAGRGAQAAAAIGSAGVTVVGDLRTLAAPPPADAAPRGRRWLPPAAAAAALTATVTGAAEPRLGGPEALLATVRSATLLRILTQRLRRRIPGGPPRRG